VAPRIAVPARQAVTNQLHDQGYRPSLNTTSGSPPKMGNPLLAAGVAVRRECEVRGAGANGVRVVNVPFRFRLYPRSEDQLWRSAPGSSGTIASSPAYYQVTGALQFQVVKNCSNIGEMYRLDFITLRVRCANQRRRSTCGPQPIQAVGTGLARLVMEPLMLHAPHDALETLDCRRPDPQ